MTANKEVVDETYIRDKILIAAVYLFWSGKNVHVPQKQIKNPFWVEETNMDSTNCHCKRNLAA